VALSEARVLLAELVPDADHKLLDDLEERSARSGFIYLQQQLGI